MSLTATRRPRRRSRGSILVWSVRALVIGLVFALGVALGQALEERPPPAPQVTSFATIEPWTQTVGVTTQTVTAP